MPTGPTGGTDDPAPDNARPGSHGTFGGTSGLRSLEPGPHFPAVNDEGAAALYIL